MGFSLSRLTAVGSPVRGRDRGGGREVIGGLRVSIGVDGTKRDNCKSTDTTEFRNGLDYRSTGAIDFRK